MKNSLVSQTIYWLKICMMPSVIVIVLLTLSNNNVNHANNEEAVELQGSNTK